MMIKIIKVNLNNLIVNILCFIFLIIGLQNANTSKKVDLILKESINLPIGFIIGGSFLSGSVIGGLIYSLRDDL